MYNVREIFQEGCRVSRCGTKSGLGYVSRKGGKQKKEERTNTKSGLLHILEFHFRHRISFCSISYFYLAVKNITSPTESSFTIRMKFI